MSESAIGCISTDKSEITRDSKSGEESDTRENGSPMVCDVAAEISPALCEAAASSPLHDESSSQENQGGRYIREGKAEIINTGKVFYNPVMEFNRDLSVAVLSLLAKERTTGAVEQTRGGFQSCEASGGGGLRVLDALSATGLRAIRYAKEVAGVERVVANDLLESAVTAIRANLRHNRLEEDRVTVSRADAALFMYNSGRSFDAIDLDPYGSPAKFLDSAVQSVKEGGLLLVTCTDMAVLAGSAPEACFLKYGSVPLRFPASHEMALRIVLRSIQSRAAVYHRYIEPLLSVYVDFYLRVVVRLRTSPARCKAALSETSQVYVCCGCKSYETQPLGTRTERTDKPPLYGVSLCPSFDRICTHCGSQYRMGGPVWNGRLHDKEFVTRLLELVEGGELELATRRRLEGVLGLILQELELPFFVSTRALSAALHCSTIPLLLFRSALLQGGWEISESHVLYGSVKTNAPPAYIWEIMREWVRLHPVSEARLSREPVMSALLRSAQTSTAAIDLTGPTHPAAALSRGILRFQPNPQPFWGPGDRNRSNDLAEVEKRRKKKTKKKERGGGEKRERTEEEEGGGRERREGGGGSKKWHGTDGGQSNSCEGTEGTDDGQNKK